MTLGKISNLLTQDFSFPVLSMVRWTILCSSLQVIMSCQEISQIDSDRKHDANTPSDGEVSIQSDLASGSALGLAYQPFQYGNIKPLPMPEIKVVTSEKSWPIIQSSTDAEFHVVFEGPTQVPKSEKAEKVFFAKDNKFHTGILTQWGWYRILARAYDGYYFGDSYAVKWFYNEQNDAEIIRPGLTFGAESLFANQAFNFNIHTGVVRDDVVGYRLLVETKYRQIDTANRFRVNTDVVNTNEIPIGPGYSKVSLPFSWWGQFPCHDSKYNSANDCTFSLSFRAIFRDGSQSLPASLEHFNPGRIAQNPLDYSTLALSVKDISQGSNSDSSDEVRIEWSMPPQSEELTAIVEIGSSIASLNNSIYKLQTQSNAISVPKHLFRFNRNTPINVRLVDKLQATLTKGTVFYTYHAKKLEVVGSRYVMQCSNDPYTSCRQGYGSDISLSFTSLGEGASYEVWGRNLTTKVDKVIYEQMIGEKYPDLINPNRSKVYRSDVFNQHASYGKVGDVIRFWVRGQGADGLKTSWSDPFDVTLLAHHPKGFAAALDKHLKLDSPSGLYYNSTGNGLYWMRSATDGKWYFLEPNQGFLYQWDGSTRGPEIFIQSTYVARTFANTNNAEEVLKNLVQADDSE